MQPTTSLTWSNPKPRLLEKASPSRPSGSTATLPRDTAASSVQPHPAIMSLLSPSTYPKSRPLPGISQDGYGFCALTTSGCALWVMSEHLGVCSAAAQDGWGRSVQVLIRGPLRPPSHSSKIYFKFMTST